MNKSLVVIASALLLAVGAAGTQRLRYDATVFAGAEQVSSAVGRRAAQVEYPPCVRGVREDRCIQLYERGVRRSYARWLAAHGVRQAAAAPGMRRYRPCRSRTDDNCRQVARVRSARAARRAAPARAVAARSAARARARAAAVNRTRWTRAAARRQARARQQRQVALVRRAPQAAPRPTAPATRNTPGI